MFSNRFVKVATLLAVAMIIGLLGYTFKQGGVAHAEVAARQTAKANLVTNGNTLEIEVAENGTRFIADETPTFEDGLPAAGAEYITEGYIYPAGTLTCENNECNGVLENGEPEFPDLVIGTWVCRGWFIGDGFHTETGVWVAATQIFDFGETAGSNMIVTDGLEGPEYDVVDIRAIVGGTGQYRNVRGEQHQTLLGWNGTLGEALQVSFELIGAGEN